MHSSLEERKKERKKRQNDRHIQAKKIKEKQKESYLWETAALPDLSLRPTTSPTQAGIETEQHLDKLSLYYLFFLSLFITLHITSTSSLCWRGRRGGREGGGFQQHKWMTKSASKWARTIKNIFCSEPKKEVNIHIIFFLQVKVTNDLQRGRLLLANWWLVSYYRMDIKNKIWWHGEDEAEQPEILGEV